MRAKEEGAIISFSFTLWQEKVKGRKYRFFISLSKQSKRWLTVSVRMEALPLFAINIQKRRLHFYAGHREKI